MIDVKFPNVNYIGNKEKISSWIVDNFPIESGSVLDAFAGGGSLSFELKRRGFRVISNDALYAAYVINKALIENNKVALSEKDIMKYETIKLDNNQSSRFEWLKNTLYYAEEVDELAKLVLYSEKLLGYKKYLFQALIRRSMIRKLPYSRMNLDWNNIIKLRDEEYSYAKYGRRRAYHNESFISHILKEYEAYNKAVFDNGQKNRAIQMDIISAINKSKGVDVVYLDPPYPGTMNKYDEFYGKFDKIFDKDIDYVPMISYSQFWEGIEQIVATASQKADYLVLSLNSNSKPSFEEVVDLFSFWGEVEVKTRKHNYQVSGKQTKNQNLEMLAIVKFFK